jgi:pectin methylesterase-like acyl-CoA thioesterase
MGIVSKNGGNVKRSVRNALTMAAAVGAAACLGRNAMAADYIVDPNYVGTQGVPVSGYGYAGVYSSVNQALVGTSPVGSGASASNPNRIFVLPGTYTTTVSIAYSKNNVDIIGMDLTTSTPADVVITSTLDADYNTGGSTLGTTNASTIQIKGNNTVVADLTIANSTDTPYIVNVKKQAQTPTGGFQATQVQTGSAPAVALLTQGDAQSFINVSILGYQDTLYMKGGRNYYTNSTISGDNDFIFANGTSVFNNDTINVDGNHAGGQVTAASTNKSTSNGLVFINSQLTSNTVQGSIIDPMGSAVSGGATPGSMGLGRSWGWQQTGGDASVVYINDEMTNAIASTGWIIWNNNETNGSVGPGISTAPIGLYPAPFGKNNGNPGMDSRFAEYNSMDLLGNTLNVSSRVSWSHQMNATQAAAYTTSAYQAGFSILNIFAFESAYGWYGNGYSDPNSFPSFWGTRNLNNDNLVESAPNGVTGNPTSYSNATWQAANDNGIAGAAYWDPNAQLASVPEPASVSLLGGAAAMLMWRRRNAKAEKKA